MMRVNITRLFEAGLISLAAVHTVSVSHAGEGMEMHGSAEIGVGNVALDHPNSKYGEYTGIGDDETYLIGGIDLSVDDGPDYLGLRANQLGLDSRNLTIEAGEYGVYSLGFGYDAIPHLISSNDKTPFSGAGGDRLTLPDGFTRAATTTGMTSLGEDLKTLDLRTDRTENLFRLSRSFVDGWQANLSLRREDKSGVQSLGGITAQNGGQVDSVILPQPVEYRTEEFSAALAFNGKDRQLELGYFLSMFHNENSSITWDVPFLKAAPAALDYPAVARIGLPPDNEYQRVSINGGMNFAYSTRISAVIELGRMSQDDVFLPYSTDDIGGTATVLENGNALPRSSADAEVDIAHAVLNATSRPLPGLGVNARYRYYQTDNKTPYTLFDRVINDTVPQTTTQDIYSRPYDYSRSTLGIGANYRFDDGTRLKTDYGHEIIDYDRYRSVRGTVEDSVRASLGKALTDTVEGRLGYVRMRREADNYDAFISYSTLIAALACPSIVTVDPDPDTGGATSVDTCFDNHPDIRQFDLASRDRDRLSAALTYAPDDALDFGLDVAANRDVYDDDVAFDNTYLGLTEDDTLSITLDAGYAPAGEWSVNAYYTRERIRSSQTGRAYNNTTASAIDSSLNWTADFDDTVDTLGVSTAIDLLYDSLRLAVSYEYSRGVSRIGFATGDGLTYEDMPEDGSERHTVDMKAVYKLRDDLAVGLGVGYERFRADDWSLDSVAAGGTALNDVLLLSGPQQDYRAYLFEATMIYSW